MSDPTTRLLAVYRQELEAYREVLDLAKAGVETVRHGSPLSVLHQINLQKQRHLDGIADLESSVAGDKERWRNGRQFGPASAELDALLGEITGLIEEILDQERETDRWILRGSGLTPQDLAIA